jgi:hypothetical protein
MLISKYNLKISLFIITLLLIKIFLLFIIPRELSFYLSGLNSWSYFSSMSFNVDMQSFRDGNHPGTPFYILQKIFFVFIGNKIEQFYNFFYLNHLLLISVNILSIKTFYNFFRKKISNLETISFLLIFSSSFNFFIGLEIVDLISYQFSLTLFLITYFFKSLEKNKIIKLAILSAFAISMKMTFFPFVVSIFCAKILFLILGNNKIKKITLFLSSFSLSYLFFNFPILGRIPKIFLDSLFLRSDTKIDFNTIPRSISYSIDQIFYENILFFLIIVFSLIIFIFNLYNFVQNFYKTKKKPNKEFSIFFFSCLITFFYIYTFIAAGQSYYEDFEIHNLERENILRNNYPYISFIIINFLIFKKNLKFLFIKKKYLIFFSILVFIISSFNYIYERDLIIKNKNEKRQILNSKLSKYIDLNNDTLAIYTHSIGYGLSDEFFFLNGNYIEGNEFFTKEIVDIYPRFRHFRLDDLIDKLNLVESTYQNEKINSFKNKIKKFDIVLKRKLPKEIYESLSYQTKNTILNKNKYRSYEIFSFENDTNYEKPSGILFYHPDIANGTLNENRIFEYINNFHNISNKIKINVLNDNWYLYILN